MKPFVTMKMSWASLCMWKPGASARTASEVKTEKALLVCLAEARMRKTPLLPGIVMHSPSSCGIR